MLRPPTPSIRAYGPVLLLVCALMQADLAHARGQCQELLKKAQESYREGRLPQARASVEALSSRRSRSASSGAFPRLAGQNPPRP